MERYNYFEAVKDDIRTYIFGNEITVNEDNREDLGRALEDDLLQCDNVTGNASGSYTYDRWQAEENLAHNFGLLQDALQCYGNNILAEDAESCDVLIRCHLLPQAIKAVLDELMDEDNGQKHN